MKAHGQPPAERVTLTPFDQAFLESPPTYEDDGAVSLLPSLPPPALPAPSTARRALSLVLFVAIAGTAAAVLVLAVVRYLGR